MTESGYAQSKHQRDQGRALAIARRKLRRALQRNLDCTWARSGIARFVEITRVPPGKYNFPYHAHSTAWELYLVISGKGSVRHKDGTTEVVAGDAFIFGPDEPHQLSNTGTEDFVYYVIADNPIGESAYYPDSGKWKVNKSSAADRVVLKGNETDYFDGEE